MKRIDLQYVSTDFSLKEKKDSTEINSFGRMNTWMGDTSKEYHLTIITHEPGNCSLQIGFCDESFSVQEPLFHCSKKFCGSVFYGVGDDRQGMSVAYDPVQSKSWNKGKPRNVEKIDIENGDFFHCTYNDNFVEIDVFKKNSSKMKKIKLPTITFKNPRPCFSLMNNISVKVCKSAKLNV